MLRSSTGSPGLLGQSYPFSVKAVGLSAESGLTPVTITVRPPTPAFELSVATAPTLTANVAGPYTFNVTTYNGFVGVIALACLTPPANVTCVQTGSATGNTLSLNVTAPAGVNASVTVRGTSGALTADTWIYVVTPASGATLQSVVFDGTRSLTYEGLANLTSPRQASRLTSRSA